ncbi:cupin domain-containing protein [Mangrovimonas sp. AS39]|uniref:cupin domain-containing protein n=1 Tax=Mangrovimonas futianensis TaxID=2895523 RepID=UPI001E329E5F|nr:cupin domain-containing protein [Mangrovimonas futianensis]MCF1192228.1 cupin domain-containing protein [Mangrovimonas futianensis]MCF1196023.1 cupin domain-containing protein [Mangrovimonas futianensis]
MKYFKFSLLVISIGFLGLFQSCKQAPEKQEELTNQTEEKPATTNQAVSDLNFIFPKGQKGPDKNFTGNAYNYGIVMDTTLTTIVGNVYFEPGARSNWHKHPAGQILVITDGVGYHQIEGQPIEVIKKGDAVTCPPDTRHWHGASKDIGLQQMYIVPNIEKGVVEWMEPVTDEQYNNL